MTSEGGGATGSTRSSKQPTPRPSTAPGSSAASSAQSQRRLGSSSAGSPANELHDQGDGERRSHVSTAELKAEAVRRDLIKLVLQYMMDAIMV